MRFSRILSVGDWVETDQMEVGLICSLRTENNYTIAEICVGRCYRDVPVKTLRFLNLRTPKPK